MDRITEALNLPIPYEHDVIAWKLTPANRQFAVVSTAHWPCPFEVFEIMPNGILGSAHMYDSRVDAMNEFNARSASPARPAA